jgi:hypothetical protein
MAKDNHMAFQFDPKLTVEDNLQRFSDALNAQDPEFAVIFRTHIYLMLPFSAEANDRGDARVAFNKAIAAALDALGETP